MKSRVAATLVALAFLNVIAILLILFPRKYPKNYIRRIIKLKRGPPTQKHLDHHFINFAATEVYNSVDNRVIHDVVAKQKMKMLRYRVAHLIDAKKFREEWINRIFDFRKLLIINNVEKNTSLIEENWNDDILVTMGVVVDMALVIPVNLRLLNMSWVTLESLRQQVVFPREIILILTGSDYVDESRLLGYLGVIQEMYGSSLPDGCVMKVYISEVLYKPGENRWFGFNRTTASIVTLFDGDDYMHPQLFQILWHVFTVRPELDQAMITYHAGTVEGIYRADIYYDKLLEFLRNYQHTSKFISKIADYPERDYEALRESVPSWNKTWYLGNTDAEPNWREDMKWWDYGCHNGWSTFRRNVMLTIPPPTDMYGGEDAVYNYRVIKAGFNYKCLPIVLGSYLKCFCNTENKHL